MLDDPSKVTSYGCLFQYICSYLTLFYLIVVDASEAGRGALDLSVGPPGRTLPHSIKEIQPQQYIIEFTPEEPVDHEVNIQFNEIHIPGKLTCWC